MSQTTSPSQSQCFSHSQSLSPRLFSSASPSSTSTTPPGPPVRLIVTTFGPAFGTGRLQSEVNLCSLPNPINALVTASGGLRVKFLGTRAYYAHIRQDVYSVPGPNITTDYLAELRHHPKISHDIEDVDSCELIIDLVPGPIPMPGSIGRTIYHRPLRLALFDMDSTLINEEVIDELARSIGKADAVSAITARAMNGELDFAASLKQRVAMLRGVRADVWDELKHIVTIANGARELIQELRARGVMTGVVSGGFMPMAEWLKDELGLDFAVANHLVVSPAKPKDKNKHATLTGTLSRTEPMVTPEFKRATLLRVAQEHDIPISETFAVGDGSNDLLMLHAAGLGVAWNAKPKVQAAAPMRLNGTSLAELLMLFMSPEEMKGIKTESGVADEMQTVVKKEEDADEDA